MNINLIRYTTNIGVIISQELIRKSVKSVIIGLNLYG